MYGELPEVEVVVSIDGETVPTLDKLHGFPVHIPNPEKTALLRLPTPGELIAYMSAQRDLYKDLGRGMGEEEDAPNLKAAVKLFTAVRLDPNGTPFDDSEAQYSIDQLTRLSTLDCSRDGQTYVVQLNTMFGVVTHTVSIPFIRDLAEYRRNAIRSRNLPNAYTERRYPPEAAVRLFDKIVIGSVGYADGVEVPPHHKRAVCAAVSITLSQMDAGPDPNS